MQVRGRRRDLAELAIAYALILAVIWTPRPLQRVLWIFAVVVIAIIIGFSFESLRAMGLRTANFFHSLWIVGVALLVSGVAVATAARLHTLHGPSAPLPLIEDFWSYFIWSGVQQFLLQCFFLSRLVRLLPKPRQAALVAAALFALAHLPNPVLAGLTIIWGSVACLVFLRYRNLYPLAMAHAVLGVTIAVAVPGAIDHNMRVGLGYLKYHRGQQYRPVVEAHPGRTTADSVKNLGS